jgi:hypothetical protein
VHDALFCYVVWVSDPGNNAAAAHLPSSGCGAACPLGSHPVWKQTLNDSLLSCMAGNTFDEGTNFEGESFAASAPTLRVHGRSWSFARPMVSPPLQAKTRLRMAGLGMRSMKPLGGKNLTPTSWREICSSCRPPLGLLRGLGAATGLRRP